MGKGIVIGFIAALVFLAVGAYVYVGFGLVPVATNSEPLPFEKLLANRALHAVIAKAGDPPPLADASEPNLKQGATIYREHCAVCHGLPGQEMTAIAKGMFPKVPQLFKGKGVTDDPPSESFWKVQNGIRLTGMPGFKGSLTDQQMWQVSQLVANADKMSESVKEELNRKN